MGSTCEIHLRDPLRDPLLDPLAGVAAGGKGDSLLIWVSVDLVSADLVPNDGFLTVFLDHTGCGICFVACAPNIANTECVIRAVTKLSHRKFAIDHQQHS